MSDEGGDGMTGHLPAGLPIRVCCGRHHFGPQCPDGLVMCCHCFARFAVDQLAVIDGEKFNVCAGCHSQEVQRMEIATARAEAQE